MTEIERLRRREQTLSSTLTHVAWHLGVLSTSPDPDLAAKADEALERARAVILGEATDE